MVATILWEESLLQKAKTTIAYIASVFQQIGLKPANKGSYFQEVPLVEVTNNS